VEVRYDEGIATHIGPEPCAVVREDIGEASAGECIGQPLSREIGLFLGADAVLQAEGNMDGTLLRVPARPSAVVDPGMCGRSLRGNREISCLTRGGPLSLVRTGKARSRSR
jgi:hypothetical protein